MSSDSAIKTAPGAQPALRIPEHIGVIMDGNGRWAKARGKPRTEGHVAGVKALRRMVELCIRYGVGHLTVFSFSSENWSRPPEEVKFIFGLLHRFVASDLARLVANNVKIRIIGDRATLDEALQRLIADVERKTAGNTGLQLVVAFNYGGKAEITEATRQIARAVAAGLIKPDDISEHTIQAALYTAGLPDPDLIIRTSGEQRFSNFLLWQAAYSELVFVEDNWPDFDEDTFVRVLEEYGMRERRFGAVEAHGR
jgi:undecaprenyl diphosphate synthase